MKKFLLWCIGLVTSVLVWHQTYLASIASYAPELAASKWSLIAQWFTDNDGDWIDDANDNCVWIYNPDQADKDGDWKWDVCDSTDGWSSNDWTSWWSGDCGPYDSDTDNDGVCDSVDNCHRVYNPSQADSDNDWDWDACDTQDYWPCWAYDTDTDHDWVCDSVDNCVWVSNPSQQDTDNDGHGDKCDEPVECTTGQMRSCGSDVGECKKWTEKCVNYKWEWICRDDIGPTWEVCDGLDNDCDWKIDDWINCNPAQDGVCWNANWTCSSWQFQNVDVSHACNTTSKWKCLGDDLWFDDTCTYKNDPCAPNPTNWYCGSSFWTCSSWTATDMNNTACGADDTWTCIWSNQGSPDYCRKSDTCPYVPPTYNPTPIHWYCGSSFWVCNTWTAINTKNTACGTSDTWTCIWSNGGSADSCSVQDVCPSTPWNCGSSFWICASWVATNLNNSSCWTPDTWTCEWTNKGTPDYCQVQDICPATHWNCGSNFWTCASWVATNLNNSSCWAPDTWTCEWKNNGIPDYCQVQDICPPQNGTCWVVFGTCVRWTASNKKNTACGSDDTWTCEWEYAWVTDYCRTTDVCKDPCEWRWGDQDNDWICTQKDNCPYTYNPNQKDTNWFEDRKGKWDVCEIIPDCHNRWWDSDNDSVCDLDDNCPYISNRNQRDTYGDRRGDACEEEVVVLECDHGQTRACSWNNIWLCSAWIQRCHNGYRSSVCEQQVTPVNEVCDGYDNDCDGSIDEWNVCAPVCHPSVEVCNNKDDDCDWQIDEWNVCTPVCHPTVEVCNNRDDDCDWQIDEWNCCEPVDPCEHAGRDLDNDGICGNADNCPNIYNPQQEDRNWYLDNDLRGDVCEVVPLKPIRQVSQHQYQCIDSDNDGLCNEEDSCPTIFWLINNFWCPWWWVVHYQPVDSWCNTRWWDTDRDGICDFDDVCPNITWSSTNNWCSWTNTCPYWYPDDWNWGCGSSYSHTTQGYTSIWPGTRAEWYYDPYSNNPRFIAPADGCRAWYVPNWYGGCMKGTVVKTTTHTNTSWSYNDSGSWGTTRSWYQCRDWYTPNWYGGCMKLW